MDFENIPFETQNRKSTKSLLYLYGAVVAMFLMTLFSWVFSQNKRIQELYQRANTQQQAFQKQRLEGGQLIATQEQRILELTKENMALVETVNKFKSIQGQVKIQTNTVIKEIKVPYPVDVVKYVDTSTNNVYLRLPTPIERCDSALRLYGVIGIDGLEIDSLIVPNELTITTGKIDGGFWKADKYVVEVTSSSPYVDITKMSNTQFKARRPIYKRWWFGFGLGAVATALIKK